MIYLQAGEGLPGLVLLLDLVRHFFLKVAGLVLITRVFQHAVFEQGIVEIVGISLTEQRTVQVKDSDAILYGDKVRAAGGGNVLHEDRDGLLCGGTVHPQAQSQLIAKKPNDLCRLTLRQSLLGVQIVLRILMEQAGTDRPLKGGHSPVRPLKAIVIAENVGILADGYILALMLCIAPEHDGKLLACYRAVRAELVHAHAACDLLRSRPAHRLGVHGVLTDVRKRHQVVYNGTFLKLPDCRSNHAASCGRVRVCP